MKKRTTKLLIGFVAAALSIVAIVVVTLLLVSDNTLKIASINCDTVTMNAAYNAENKTLSTSQTINYKNRAGVPLNEVKFHIYANAYREDAENPPVEDDEVPQAYPNGKNFGGITIEKTAVNGIETTFQTQGEDDTILYVPLGKPLEAGKNVKIDIDYVVTLANIKHRLGWTDDAVNLANFYPVPCIFENGDWQTYPYSASGDPFYNALNNYNVTITVPSNLTVASSGTLIKETNNGGQKTVILKSSAIRDFALVLSNKFKVISQKYKGAVIKYFYIYDDTPKASLETAVSAVTTFSKIYTKYPYKQLSVVQTDFLHGGMEYGELVYISSDLLNPTGEDKQPDREQHNYVIVHEIAHQWWYGMIGNNQSASAWIDEGLAEYSTLLFYERNPQYNVDRNTIVENAQRNYSAYIRLVRDVGAELNTSMDRELMDFNTSYEYVFMTYIRGLLLFCDLEKILPSGILVSALGDYCNQNKFSFATKESLVSSLEKTSGAKLGLFFDSYLSGWDGILNQ